MPNKTKPLLYIGLMSGTSADGIDLALVEFCPKTPQYANKAKLLASFYQAYDDSTRNKIMALYSPSANEIDQAGVLNIALAKQFAKAINAFLQQQKLCADDITAIGCHGQTIRHRPVISNNISEPFTLQIGCLQTLALLTDIRVVGDFRTKDMALGGQGAPLVPAFHQALFADNHSSNKEFSSKQCNDEPCSDRQDVLVVNIGGIANITFLPYKQESAIIGFDTGPGNALLDHWFLQHHQDEDATYDSKGQWARSGNISPTLLAHFLNDRYFTQPGPKSTGREYFHGQWLTEKIASYNQAQQKANTSNALTAADIQATLTALTAKSIAKDIQALSKQSSVYLCGGGTKNDYLVQLLTDALNQNAHQHRVNTTQAKGVDSDALEAMAFAWLAFAYDHNIHGNIPAVTGASRSTVLGISTA